MQIWPLSAKAAITIMAVKAPLKQRRVLQHWYLDLIHKTSVDFVMIWNVVALRNAHLTVTASCNLLSTGQLTPNSDNMPVTKHTNGTKAKKAVVKKSPQQYKAHWHNFTTPVENQGILPVKNKHL